MQLWSANIWRICMGMAAMALVLGCSKEDVSDDVAAQLADSVERSVPGTLGAETTTPVAPIDIASAQQRADSLDIMLRQVRMLTRWEQMKLRRDVNAKQIARARRLGIKPTSDLKGLLARRVLVVLPDSTRYWTLYRLNYSAPYVTPSTAALLAEIAERFQARLDSLNVPRLRLVITSALRTPENQSALRRRNSNASKIESAHEFGTTVDIAYRRFATPADSTISAMAPATIDPLRVVSDSLLMAAATKRSGELQAVLGRVLQGLADEGKVMVMMERAQTVFHITVARPLTARPAEKSR